MTRNFNRLSGKLRQMGVHQRDLTKVLGLTTPSSISYRFTGQVPWTLDEMYKVMDFIGAKPEELHLYFPPYKHRPKTAAQAQGRQTQQRM